MPFIRKLPHFEPSVTWYTGAGCLMCGNTDTGECFDTGVTDERNGRIAFCRTHAREFGLAVGMVDKDEVDALLFEAGEKVAQAANDTFEAERLREAAAKDREVVERLLRPAETPEELAESGR